MTDLQAEIIDGARVLDSLKLRLAAQLAPRRWRNSLERMASNIDGGQPLDEAFAKEQSSMPSELRALVAESLQVSAPTKLIIDALRTRERLVRSWRELVRIVTYPLILFGVALVVGITFSFILRASPHLTFFEDFGLAGGPQIIGLIDDQHWSIVGLGMIYAWTWLVMLTMALVAPRWAWNSILGGILLVGRPFRWLSMREILRRYEMFLAQGLSPVATAEAVARSFRRSGQAVTAAVVAQRMAAGMPLGQALCLSLVSDGLTRPALRMLDLRGSEMPQALAETTALLELLTEQRSRTLATVLPVFLLVLVGSIVWASLSTYLLSFMPLVSMLTSLV